MNCLKRSALASLVALSAATPVLAYTIFPLETRSHLKGTLKFINADQHMPTFRCQVDFVLRTRNPSEGISKGSEVVSAKIIQASRTCLPAIFTNGLPWAAGASDATTGVIAIGGWRGSGSCTEAETHFTVDASRRVDRVIIRVRRWNADVHPADHDQPVEPPRRAAGTRMESPRPPLMAGRAHKASMRGSRSRLR